MGTLTPVQPGEGGGYRDMALRRRATAYVIVTVFIPSPPTSTGLYLLVFLAVVSSFLSFRWLRSEPRKKQMPRKNHCPVTRKNHVLRPSLTLKYLGKVVWRCTECKTTFVMKDNRPHLFRTKK